VRAAIVLLLTTTAVEVSAAPQFYLHQVTSHHERRAEQVIKEGFQIRGHEAFPLTSPIDWSADPHDDANWRYQLNAMYPLAPIFQELAEEERPSWRRFARRVFLDWIEFNIENDQPNDFKWNDMATGVRASYLAQLIAHERRAGEITEENLQRLIDAGHEHLFVLADPELFANYNHGIFQMVGIAALCDVEAYAECADFGPYARERYHHLFTRQFNREGMHLEHSPEYHLLGLNVFTRIEDSGLLSLSAEHLAWMALARRNLQWLMHPDGGFFELGDTEASNAAGAQRHDPRVRWLRSRGRSGEPPDRGVRAFPDTGYAFARLGNGARNSYLAFSVAHHSRIHKHADTFSFEWSDRGRRVLVDSGKWGYDDSLEREYITGPWAHNVVALTGEDFSPRRPPDRMPAISASMHENLAVFSAAGDRGPGWLDATQTRRLVMNPGSWLVVVDDVRGYWPRDAVQWFQLPPDADVEPLENGFAVRFSWTDSVLRVFSLDPDLEMEARKGEQGDQWAGWYSPQYRELVPSWQIGFRSWGFRHRFATVFRWVSPEASEPQRLDIPAADPVRHCWREGDRLQGVVLEATENAVKVMSCEQ